MSSAGLPPTTPLTFRKITLVNECWNDMGVQEVVVAKEARMEHITTVSVPLIACMHLAVQSPLSLTLPPHRYLLEWPT